MPPRSSILPDGGWIDVTPLPDGTVAVAVMRPGLLEVARVPPGAPAARLWACPVEAPAGALIYLRAAADAAGRVAAIGQGQDGLAWVCREGRPLEPVVPGGPAAGRAGRPQAGPGRRPRLIDRAGPRQAPGEPQGRQAGPVETFGVFCVEIAGLAEGWQIAILREGRYELYALPLEGPAVLTASVPTPTTQGFIQIDGGTVVLQDEGRAAVPGLVLAERAGTWAVGQNPDAGPDRVRLTDDAVRYAALVYDYAQPPHVVTAADGTIWVCAWLRSGAWVAGYPPDAIPWGNEAPNPPDPPDPPDPPRPAIDPPKITIASYAPTSGPAPLAVRAVAAIDASSGPIDELQWRWRAAGGGSWAIAAVNPPDDPDHTYRFDAAGTYELSLRATGPGGADETGTPRRVTATAVTPPDPPDPPDPAGPLTGFICSDGDHYLCADLGVDDTGGQCRLVADRLACGGYETFEVIARGSGKVALRAQTNGRYLHAADGGGGGVYADRDSVGEHEEFTLEPQDDGVSVAIRTAGGQYLCAENGGGGLVAANRDSVGPWERFVTTEALKPPVPAAGRALEGRIRLVDGQGLADDLGLFVPVFYHHGDAGLWWAKDPGDVKRVLDVTGPRGAHGFRAWMGRLLPSYWDDYILDVGQFAAFQAELKQRNLRLMWDGGDLGRASREERDIVREILLTAGDRDVLASVSMCNEGNDNSDMSAQEMADWLAPIAEKWPDLPIWCTTGGAGHEFTAHLGNEGVAGYTEHQDMDHWNPGPSRLVGKHGYRDGSIVDKARHCFSFVYEGQPQAWVTVDDEPPGVGDFVSVMENRQQMTPEGTATIFLTAAIAGQWWVFFPGLEKHTQPIETFIPHLERLVAQAAQLPPDLFAFEDLEHGGSSQSRRVWEVTDSPGPETARCDHALANDDRYVCSCYDEGEAGRQNFRQRGGTEESRIENPPWGFVSIGRQ
jgi:hypothetical protein